MGKDYYVLPYYTITDIISFISYLFTVMGSLIITHFNIHGFLWKEKQESNICVCIYIYFKIITMRSSVVCTAAGHMHAFTS